ncbi:MAG: aminotransferase class I/II-fold pyridoxal phosphate-dependent enzyme [Candidatus Heimdallarchaeum endolithica]|uniref:Aminotransferase class I/II-fold pyridoxal phosphate-dependent enzyme n=1 Tax=Candidatus Heimdallarchaeum endolithica TaxID=2876572 RepID=A0A9Y1FPQ1_9ARCH|nr:MAG: aminotransferase class I/II-fold pyridoxal phosphate-dependent enzyme [Candidatus Heimdallarchaeum endolithica]
MDKKEAMKKIKPIIQEYFNSNDFTESSKIKLVVPSYGEHEVLEVIDSLLSTYVTMGEKVYSFEEQFSKYIGCKYATMVNSGSSANLLALQALANPTLENPIKPGDEIITTSLTWSTSVFPIFDINAIPVFVDVNKDSLTIDVKQLETALTSKTKAVLAVHLLGHPCQMDVLVDFCEKNDLYLIEDCCEAHGAEWNGKKVGSFGHISTYSFFFSHHISTIEGGIVLTNIDEINQLLKSLRAHGWIRERNDKTELARKYNHIDPRFLFVNKGYNLRPTEIQGAFGIHQLKKLETFLKIREENAKFWIDNLEEYRKFIHIPKIEENIRHAWFGFPIIISEKAGFKRENFVKHLEKNNIETRPIMAGNIIEQPAMNYYKWKQIGPLENSSRIMKNGFFFGNHSGIKQKEREYILKIIQSFLDHYI